MKKILLLPLVTLLLAGCADKNNYEAAILAELQRDTKTVDTRDYKVPAEKLATCIVDVSSKNMPGIFGLDPARLTAYRNYTKMLTLTQSQDPKKTMAELQTDFGSPKELVEARSNYTESELECLSSFVMSAEEPTPSEK
ncbi:MAG: hypothetical protein QX193_02465 [Methylococcales bacterium]|nr:hypothetical protein [Methylococcales bacterium]